MKFDSIAAESNIASGSVTCLSNPNSWSQVAAQAASSQVIPENEKQIITRPPQVIAVSRPVYSTSSVAGHWPMTCI